MPDLNGTPGEIIVNAIDGNLPDSLNGCDQLMQAVDSIGWMAKARICQHVRDTGIYTERFSTFEACCREMWGLSRSRVHRLIEGAEVAAVLPIGNKPSNEAQARPLTKLPADEQPGAWEEVVADAESAGEKITAKKVELVVARRVKSKPTKRSAASAEREMFKTNLCPIVLDFNDIEATAQLIADNCDEGYLDELVESLQRHLHRKD